MSEYAFGIIGGSGLYGFEGIENIEEIDLDTPFGKPSSTIISGTIHGKKLAFLARHGIGHIYSPTEVNYRANIWALKMLGIDKIVSVSAVGSLREDYAPGNIIIPDQLFDFTKDRKRSFFGDGLVAHVSTADPFCPVLSKQLLKSLEGEDTKVHEGGIFVTIEGPRFSTRGESHTFRKLGFSLVGMTASPEAYLAREAEIHYATMAHVTDYDSWHETEEAVTMDMVSSTLKKNTQIAQRSLKRLVDIIAADEKPAECGCDTALKFAFSTAPDKINPETRAKLDLLVGKYLG
jgi:5'-methylthioadenosine phosphorylase